MDFSEIDCGHPGKLPNGWLEGLGDGTALGAVIRFRCYKDMTIEGHGTTQCADNGTWTNPVPRCFGGYTKNLP